MLGRVLVQYDYDQFPYQKKLGHRHTQKEDHVRSHHNGSHLQAKEGALTRT